MAKIIASAKVTATGQVTLKKEVRKVLGIEEGDVIIFVLNDNNELVVKSEV